MPSLNDFLKQEIQQIVFLQEKFKCLEGLLTIVSESMGPTQAQLVTGPVLTVLTEGSLAETMLASTLVDYASLVLKWLLQEHRPFWFIYEPGVYTPENRPKLRQTPLTCETTAGGTSGHSAMFTIVMHLQRKWILDYLDKKFEGNRNVLNIVVSSGMVTLIILMWTSRMYLATHFLHQCVSGTGLALSLAVCTEQKYIRRKILNAKRPKAIGFALGMLAAAGLLYAGLCVRGVDPLWSVNKALECCHKKQSVSWETMPLYAVARNLGCALGIAICAPLRKRINAPKEDWVMTLKATLCSAILGSAILSNVPKDLGGCTFLTFVFGASAFHSYAMISLVPIFARLFAEADPEIKVEERVEPKGAAAEPEDDEEEEAAE